MIPIFAAVLCTNLSQCVTAVSCLFWLAGDCQVGCTGRMHQPATCLIGCTCTQLLVASSATCMLLIHYSTRYVLHATSYMLHSCTSLYMYRRSHYYRYMGTTCSCTRVTTYVGLASVAYMFLLASAYTSTRHHF